MNHQYTMKEPTIESQQRRRLKTYQEAITNYHEKKSTIQPKYKLRHTKKQSPHVNCPQNLTTTSKTLTCQRFTHPADYIKTKYKHPHEQPTYQERTNNWIPKRKKKKEKDLRHTKKQSPTYHEKIKHQKMRETKLMKYHTKTEQIDMKIKTQLTFFDLNEGTKCPQRDKRQAQNANYAYT